MKQWQKRRFVAVLLLLATVFSVTPFATSVSADDVTGIESVDPTGDLYGGRTLDEILTLISNTSYDVYKDKWGAIPVASDTSEVLVNAADVLVPQGVADPVTGKIDDSLLNPNTNLPWTDSNPKADFVQVGSDGKEVTGVYTPSSGKTTFKITVPEAGMYSVDLLYYPVANFDYNGDGVEETVSTKTTIERMFYIDGALPFNECRYLYIPRSWEYVGTDGVRVLYRVDEPVRADFASDAEYEAAYQTWFEKTGGSGNYVWDLDIQDNDIRPERLEAPQLRTYFIRDWLGYTVEPFQFYLTEGDHYFTFEATREPLVISQIRVYGYKAEDSYDYQLERWLGTGLQIYTGEDAYIVEAESPIRVSDQVLFPGTDRTSCINSPSHPANLVYNIANSSVVGQYMTYQVYVKEEGLYNIMARFRQNTRAGMFSSRRIRINGDIQFREASFLKFNYDTAFQNVVLGDGEGTDYLFHFKEGWNTVEVEVVLGDMAEYIYDIAGVINKMTASYQKILQITGTNPDTGRDYMFATLIPDVIADLAEAAVELDNIYNALVEITGATGQHIATLDTIRLLVAKMAVDEYEIAPNFLSFKNYITALQNWLYTSLAQPMKLDYLLIQSPEQETPRAKPTFFYGAFFEARAFVASFFKDYNVIGFKTDGTEEYKGTILMWNTTSREDALILRTMIDSSFTPESNIAINIRYVAQGLQESVLAGVGPDVAMMGSGTAVNWGLRSGVEILSKDYTEEDAANGLIPEGKNVGDEVYEGFDILCPRGEDGEFITPYYNEEKGKFMDITGTTDIEFSHAALEAVSLDGKTYLIPCTMNFEMSFYRIDVFAKYDMKPPRTWQELYEILPKLTTQHMTMGMQTSLAGYQMLLYQMGETMYASDYKEFNQSTTCLAAFDTLCSLFNDYSLPISYDLTRFRTGEIPIVVANWTTYNSFMDYYELRGLWTMESLIGWEQEDGTVNRSSILNVEGIVIPRGSDNPQHVWEYIKWYSGFDAQKRLARQRLAVAVNTTEKYNTANLNALLEQAWTADELATMKEQIPHLKGIPFNPGDYNIGRYVNFAFLAVYNSNANAVDSLLNYVVDINKELSRKREEYHLPFIDYYGNDPIEE